jgi:hypothetical protein
MLLTTRNNRIWRRIGLILAIPLIISYVWYSRQMTPRGGTKVGLIYGVLGLLLILFLLFHAVRKRWHRCVFGKTEVWLNAHIYFGLLAMLLIYMHAGFRFHELSATVATVLLSIVTASGVVGAIFYTLIPRRLSEVKSNIAPEEVSNRMNQLAEKIQKLGQGKSKTLQSACQLFLKENTPTRRMGWRTTFGRSREQILKTDRRLLEKIQTVPSGEQEELKQLILVANQWRDLHAQFRAQMRLKNLLESWLYLHVPLSVAMVVAIIIHLVVVAYY